MIHMITPAKTLESGSLAWKHDKDEIRGLCLVDVPKGYKAVVEKDSSFEIVSGKNKKFYFSLNGITTHYFSEENNIPLPWGVQGKNMKGSFSINVANAVKVVENSKYRENNKINLLDVLLMYNDDVKRAFERDLDDNIISNVEENEADVLVHIERLIAKELLPNGFRVGEFKIAID